MEDKGRQERPLTSAPRSSQAQKSASRRSVSEKGRMSRDCSRSPTRTDASCFSI